MMTTSQKIFAVAIFFGQLAIAFTLIAYDMLR